MIRTALVCPVEGKLGALQADLPSPFPGLQIPADHHFRERLSEADDYLLSLISPAMLKDPDYIYRYHTGQLEAPGGGRIEPTFGNKPVVAPNDADQIAALLEG